MRGKQFIASNCIERNLAANQVLWPRRENPAEMRCRCANFQPKVKKTKLSPESASAGLDQAQQSSKPVTSSTLHQPSCNLSPQLVSTFSSLQSRKFAKPSTTATLFSMIRRSQRETTAKNQVRSGYLLVGRVATAWIRTSQTDVYILYKLSRL